MGHVNIWARHLRCVEIMVELHLYLIIAPTLLKPEVWHELIRVVKIKRFK